MLTPLPPDRANPGDRIGWYHSILATDLDGDGRKELYVAGSVGLWRFVRPDEGN